MSDLSTPPDEPSPAPAEQPAASAPAAGAIRKRYSEGVERKPKEPFAYQAAKIAFWAPFVGIALGYLSRLLNASAANAGDVAMQRDVTFIMVGMELFLMVLSILLGSVALLAIRKRGAKGLLVRPLIGVVISVLVLGQTAYAINAMRHDPAVVMQRLAAEMVGEWEWSAKSDKGASVRVQLSLRADGTGNWKVDAAPAMDVPSHWQLERASAQSAPVLVMKFDKPLEVPQHVEGVHWALVGKGTDHLVLANKADDGRVVERTFNRVK